MAIAFGRLKDVPEGAPAAAGQVAAATLAVATVLAMQATGAWPFRASLIGIASGCAAAAFFGLYNARRVIEARWFDMPDAAAWQGLDLTPCAEFRALLPVFAIISLVAAVKTSGDAVVIQQVSRVRPRAIDFRGLASRTGRNDASTERLRAAGEEALSSLLQ
ncbi:MAG: hypothetical protein OXH50_19220, partial [Gemmatimonadetes bacterium]|nr:hypothetical protein [Gemmatimonadota bacterium]